MLLGRHLSHLRVLAWTEREGLSELWTRQQTNIQSEISPEGLAQIKWGAMLSPMFSGNGVVPIKYPLVRWREARDAKHEERKCFVGIFFFFLLAALSRIMLKNNFGRRQLHSRSCSLPRPHQAVLPGVAWTAWTAWTGYEPTSE